MKDFVPINKDTFQRSPKFKEWINGWTKNQCTFLDAAGWFTTSHELDEALWEENSEGFRIPGTRLHQVIGYCYPTLEGSIWT